MGTPDFAVPSLAQLIEHHEVLAVLTQPDRPAGRGRKLQASPVKTLALDAGLALMQPRSLRREPEVLARLAELAPDLVVVAAYGLLLPPALLELAPGKALNVHASLLPRWRGASPVAHAILAGDAETGISIMRMEAGLDTGPVIARRSRPIAADDSSESLTDALATLGAQLLIDCLPAWMSGQLPALAQDEALATHAPRLRKEDGRLRWDEEDAAMLERRVRAMSPWPGAFSRWRGERIKILAAAVDAAAKVSEPPAAAGSIRQRDGRPIVAAAEGWLRLDKIQLPGRKALPAEVFLRGRPDFVGERLGSGSDEDRVAASDESLPTAGRTKA
jgi:methionyl-tRNA formyltransferase